MCEALVSQSVGVVMTTERQEFEYNDEFFFDATMREDAARYFSNIWFALYSETISNEFRKHDDEARKLKTNFQIWGFRVVGLAVFGLSVAAIEPTFLHPAIDADYLHKTSSKVAAALAGLAGVASVLMGYFGMGFSERKLRWLRTRLVCERIRQWRWQYFCAHIPEAITASADDRLKQEYASRRDGEFSSFLDGLRANQENALKVVLSQSADDPDATWVRAEFKSGIQRPDLSAAIEFSDEAHATTIGKLLAAYGNVRIGAQKRYARYLVGDSGPFSTHPATQRAWLHKRGIALLMAIFVLHIIVLVGTVIFHMPALALKMISVSAIICALIALGLRTIEDGLRPSEHLGRITGYLAEVSSIEEAFNEAASGDARRYLMIALEKASYKEMVDFLQAGDRSRYVM